MLFVVFPLLFLIFYLCLYFRQFDYFVSRYVPPWVHPTWDSVCFLDLVDYFLSLVREVFSYYLFKYFLGSLFSLSSPSGTPIMQMLVDLRLFQRSQSVFIFFFSILFSILCSVAVIFTILSSRSLVHSSASVILLSIPSRVLFISVCLFFSSSRS